MIRSRVLVVVLAVAVTPASAQPDATKQIACDACARGDEIIERFSLQDVRPLAGTLAALTLADPLTTEQYARVVELRRQTPALVRLGAVDDSDLALVAAALCGASNDACTTATTRALVCLADRCEVELPPPDPRHSDPITEPCDRYVIHKRSPPLGFGLDWGNGWQRSRYPSDGRAWSFGITSRLRISNKVGVVARIDRMSGRDEAEDLNGNGRDDRSTGSITRISVLAGPSFVLDITRLESTTRFLRLDLLAGYLATRSQADESGPAAGVDLAYQLAGLRAGVRFVQAFGDASEATMVLAHIGVAVGGGPEYSHGSGCTGGMHDRSSRLALGFDVPLGGYGISSQLGYLAPGLGVEAKWYLTRSFDAVARTDLLVFPGDERDRLIHQGLLAGLRIDHGKDTQRSSRTGLFSTVLAGYSHGAGVTPSTVGSGPVVDVSVAWGGQGRDGAGWLRLHARFGIAPDNIDYRVLMLSTGFEFRFDPRRWRDRV